MESNTWCVMSLYVIKTMIFMTWCCVLCVVCYRRRYRRQKNLLVYVYGFGRNYKTGRPTFMDVTQFSGIIYIYIYIVVLNRWKISLQYNGFYVMDTTACLIRFTSKYFTILTEKLEKSIGYDYIVCMYGCMHACIWRIDQMRSMHNPLFVFYCESLFKLEQGFF